MSLLSRLAVAAAQVMARGTAPQDPLAGLLGPMLRGAPLMLAPPQLRLLLVLLAAPGWGRSSGAGSARGRACRSGQSVCAKRWARHG
ncbi:hypothetical protein [Elioraea sp.]|uniref:hypothetical protein n=1 Tax=Elioraea sp. TaxID=2185103 RepID=UPI003F717CD6